MDYLDVCSRWKMDADEAKAYQISLMWYEYVQKLFPKYMTRKLKKGDPRKSLVFKYCYKLVRETKGIIDDKDYSLYVKAQLAVLKSVTFDDNSHPRIEPSILVGEKAWWRWTKFKKLYDNRTSQVHGDVKITTPIAKIRSELENTKVFLTKVCSGPPTIQKYQEAITNKNLFRWINIGKISPYYLALSPFIATLFPDGFGKEVAIDLEVYRKAVESEEIQSYFKAEFAYES